MFGFVAGVAWFAALDLELSARVVGLVVVACVLADLPALRRRRARALSTGRQVPQAWGRIFSPTVAAFLYGARLGVGPLTILNTWLWWGAALLGAAAGPWWSCAVGALFGASRIATVLAGSHWLERAPATRMRALRRSSANAAVALAILALLCSFTIAIVRPGTVDASTEGSSPSDDPRLLTAELEARAPNSAVKTDAGGEEARSPSGHDVESRATELELGALLPIDIGDGFEVLPPDSKRGTGALSLARAAALERDAAAERALLETRHFRSGFARAWKGSAGSVAYCAVYEFASATDADAYLVDGFITLEGRGVTVWDAASAGVPRARGFSHASEQSDGSTVSHGVTFVRANRFFLVLRSARNSAATTADAVALALRVDQAASTGSSAASG